MATNEPFNFLWSAFRFPNFHYLLQTKYVLLAYLSSSQFFVSSHKLILIESMTKNSILLILWKFKFNLKFVFPLSYVHFPTTNFLQLQTFFYEGISWPKLRIKKMIILNHQKLIEF
jgi:hypothetical protein